MESMMRKVLLTSVAALLLATGTAHANHSDDYSRRLYCEWMNEVNQDQETTENVCDKSTPRTEPPARTELPDARTEPTDEFAGEWPKGIAGVWCFESKSKVGDGIEALFTHGDCSKTPERSLQVEADRYRIAYDTCTIGKVMLWLGTGPRDEPR
jgi:hypothetical protein